ncbi:helix-turn-helix transcriptional regulator [Oceanobacillus oncorhynchi]|uniref:helix-turn-helix domain-containing protein n=1 Tax=Oceanobacillus oncorhynchi TaxID=545501 RepID=UPI002F96175C
MTNDFGEFLKAKRNKKGYTINQLSMYTGISAAQLSRIENGKRGVPKVENIRKLSDALSVPFGDMLNAAGYSRKEGVHTNEQNHLTEKDEKDIAKRMAEIRKDLEEGTGKDGLNFMGEPMSEDAKESLLEALEYAERQATRINKKYAPNKYKKKQ